MLKLLSITVCSIVRCAYLVGYVTQHVYKAVQSIPKVTELIRGIPIEMG